jgi:hypothetical protein
MTSWIKRQSSMRGRLSLLLMVVVVVPMMVVGLAAWKARADEERDGRGQIRTDEVEAALMLRVHAAALGMERRLHASTSDFGSRAGRLTGVTATDVAAAFGDLAPAAQPTLVAELDAQGASRPPLPDPLRFALLELLSIPGSVAGYAMLPAAAHGPEEGPPEGRGAGLHQFVVAPRPDGRRVVVARPMTPALAACLFGDLPGDSGLGQRLVLLAGGQAAPGTVDLPRGVDAALVERAARTLAAGDAFHEFGEHGAVAAFAVPGPSGAPVALGLVAHDGADSLPLVRRQAALLSSMLSILGLMSAAGVIAAVLMGALAPRLVWRDIRKSTDFIFRSVDRLRELVQRNQAALDEQSRLTRSLLESVASLEAASKDILRTAGALAHKAEQSAWVSQTGNQKAELAQRSVLEVRERVVDLSSQMEELGRRCDEIGSLTSFINHLSTETNALSINATIQAAGSGGNGRQQAIMAGEIQRLADLSQDSTRDINHLVERIQGASRATLGASKDGCEQVDRAKACCEELEAAFARILRWVEETTQAARGIERSTEEQAGSLQHVSQAIEQLEQRSRFTTGNFQDIVSAADELAELGNQMNETWKVG